MAREGKVLVQIVPDHGRIHDETGGDIFDQHEGGIEGQIGVGDGEPPVGGVVQ